MTSDVRVVLVTVPDDDDLSAHIARTLVEERLCACVNVMGGVRSFYRWEGAVQHDAERLLIVKTVTDQLPALIARVQALHPYDLPEVLALPVSAGLEPYLKWVEAQSLPRAD